MLLETDFHLTARNGWPIRGDLRRQRRGGEEGLVVISHGFKGFKDWGFFPDVAREIAGAGFTAVSFNFSGSGIGDNPLEFTALDRFRANTLTREIEDLEQVLNAAISGVIPEVPGQFRRPAALFGHSRGGVASLMVARRRPEVGRVVTWAGVGLIRERFPDEMRAEWRRRGVTEVVNSRTGQVMPIGLAALDDLEAHFDDYDPLRAMKELRIPCLIVHGTADRSVPFSEGEALAAAGKANPGARFEPIEGADHTFGAVHPYAGRPPHLEAALNRTLSFLAETVPVPR